VPTSSAAQAQQPVPGPAGKRLLRARPPAPAPNPPPATAQASARHTATERVPTSSSRLHLASDSPGKGSHVWSRPPFASPRSIAPTFIRRGRRVLGDSYGSSLKDFPAAPILDRQIYRLRVEPAAVWSGTRIERVRCAV